MENYTQIKKSLIKGWNTWNTRSVLSHVLLPQGFAVNLCLKDYATGDYLREALLGRADAVGCGQRHDNSAEKIYLGGHAYDGSYTELKIVWRGTEAKVQSATIKNDLVILLTTEKTPKCPASLVIEPGILWGKKGHISLEEGTIIANLPDGEVGVFVTEEGIFEPGVPTQTPYIAVTLDKMIGVSTGTKRSLKEIIKIIEINKQKYDQEKEKYGEKSELYFAMQCSLAWDTIYEPIKDRVITPISRIWNCEWGGYAIYCWDTYLAAYMASFDNKELAYCNAIEITLEKTKEGFVPNCSSGSGFKTLDRSQPPLGSMVILKLYHKYKDKWLLEMLFDHLLSWNRWYFENREIEEGILALGSRPYESVIGNYWEQAGVGNTYGAAMESGLDNSPMYDEVPFNKETSLMMMGDVGQTSLYIMDCNCLSEIATILGRESEASEISLRAQRFLKGLSSLWSEDKSIYLNKRMDTGIQSERISPTNLYPLLTAAIPKENAELMIEKHFYNPDEFWGEWMIPSSPRNDPAYGDQDYWRGRIWAPLNFLVYLGLRHYDFEKARKDLAEKSEKLLLKEWIENRHIHENYNANSGEGCDKPNSDKFYHWGALLSLIALMEAGYMNDIQDKKL